MNSDVHDLVFAKMNFDKNDIDGLKLDSFPTVYLYKKDDKENPINYDAMRDYEVILNFLEDKLGRSLYVRKMSEEVANM